MKKKKMRYRKKWFLFFLLVVLTACEEEVPFQGTGGQDYIPGYRKSLSGEVLRYHAPQPGIRDALLVRSIKRGLYIEWETDTVPTGFRDDTLRFIWLCAIDVNEEQHHFDLYVNGEKILSFRNPRTKDERRWRIRGKEGMVLEFRSVMVDKYGDLAGYMTLSVPVGKVKKGEPVRLKIMGETADSRVWYMTYRYAPRPELKITSQEAVIRDQDGGKKNVVRIDVIHLGELDTVLFRAGKIRRTVVLAPGSNDFYLYFPVVEKEKRIPFVIEKEGKVLAREHILLAPVKQRTIWLLHHSHVDIGYTHVQAEVQRIQWRNLERALQYVRETRDNPEGDRFKWNVEVMWPLVTWFRQAGHLEKEQMIEAIREGNIELDALFANELTGLCRPEELVQLVVPARRLADSLGVPLRSAMISDIPGYTWGLIPVLAKNGVRYFSIGTNTFDHIGHILEDLGDKPFYWESPSGREKVLCWVHGKGYSMFHGGVENRTAEQALREKDVFGYMKELKEKGYPYDIVALRYNIGSDNGPPDSLLTEAVRLWNEKYYSPRMVIATVGELFETFEQEYGSRLPVLRGDLTPYWSDGAASSAYELAVNRASAVRTVQASTLFAMFRPSEYPYDDFQKTWENILLFDEHTWGSWNSISAPDDPFTLSQWATKRSFAIRGEKLSRELWKRGLPPVGEKAAAGRLTVINTLSWPRTGVVRVEGLSNGKRLMVREVKGDEVPSQWSEEGTLLFLAGDVPPFGWKEYDLVETGDDPGTRTRKDPWLLENDRLVLAVDPRNGSIRSMKRKDSGEELADTLYGQGLNGYVYIAGRKPLHPQIPAPPEVVRTEDGPLYRSVYIRDAAPGTYGLEREIRLWYNGMVEIVNTLDKKKIYTPEAVYFTFPFRLPGAELSFDIAWGSFRPEKDQLPGSCKNYFTLQQGAVVSGGAQGVIWLTPDAPMAELGRITTDANQLGWRTTVQKPYNYLISWVMNNYWGTNYKASQEGKTTFRYYMIPYDPDRISGKTMIKRYGEEVLQPLIALKGSLRESGMEKLPYPQDSTLMVTWVGPVSGGLLMRVFNPSEKQRVLELSRADRLNSRIFLSDPLGKEKKPLPEGWMIEPYDFVTIFLEKEDQ